MAISLKSLYDQVQNIRTNTGTYTEEILFSGNGADTTLTVPNMSKYDAIRFYHARNNDFHLISELCIKYSDLRGRRVSIDYEGGEAAITWNSDTSLTVHGGAKGFVRRAYGIIWSKAI